jgi:hypothetical protein
MGYVDKDIVIKWQQTGLLDDIPKYHDKALFALKFEELAHFLVSNQEKYNIDTNDNLEVMSFVVIKRVCLKGHFKFSAKDLFFDMANDFGLLFTGDREHLKRMASIRYNGMVDLEPEIACIFVEDYVPYKRAVLLESDSHNVSRIVKKYNELNG